VSSLVSFPILPSLFSHQMALSLFGKRAATRQLQVASARSFSTPVDDAFSSLPHTATPPASPGASRTLIDAVNARAPRHNWTRDEIREIYNTPLMELAFQAVRTVNWFI
jgi:biotin synthase